LSVPAFAINFEIGYAVAIRIGIDERAAAAVRGVPNRIRARSAQIRGVSCLLPLPDKIRKTMRKSGIRARVAVGDETPEVQFVDAFIKIVDYIPL
jgi:hypothetical protein